MIFDNLATTFKNLHSNTLTEIRIQTDPIRVLNEALNSLKTGLEAAKRLKKAKSALWPQDNWPSKESQRFGKLERLLEDLEGEVIRPLQKFKDLKRAAREAQKEEITTALTAKRRWVDEQRATCKSLAEEGKGGWISRYVGVPWNWLNSAILVALVGGAATLGVQYLQETGVTRTETRQTRDQMESRFGDARQAIDDALAANANTTLRTNRLDAAFQALNGTNTDNKLSDLIQKLKTRGAGIKADEAAEAARKFQSHIAAAVLVNSTATVDTNLVKQWIGAIDEFKRVNFP